MQSGIYEGTVRHRRFEPSRHDFRASLFMMYLDLDELPTLFNNRWLWSLERPNIAVFRRRDHLGDAIVPLDETIRNLVESTTGNRPDGPIRILTHLRYFGYCFNPLSVFFCFDESGERLHTVVAEVTNTPWGERHCYVLPVRSDDSVTTNDESDPAESSIHKQAFSFAKTFHVSPFMEMDVDYRWQLSGPGKQITLHTENWHGGQSFFDATLVLKRCEITAWSLARVLIRYPFMTLQVIANIHWQALRLWWKKVPYVPHPDSGRTETKDKNVDAAEGSSV